MDIFPSSYYELNTRVRLYLLFGLIFSAFVGKIAGFPPFDKLELLLSQKNTHYLWQIEWSSVLLNELNNIISDLQDYYYMELGNLKNAKIYDIQELINAKIILNK